MCEVGATFNNIYISQTHLVIRRVPNIHSFILLCYHSTWSLWPCKNTAIKSYTFLCECVCACVSQGSILFLKWIPHYFVLQQRLDWAPRPINIHDSCIAHKHIHTQWWSERNRPDALIHRWIAAVMDWGYLDIHTLSWWWSEAIPSPHLMPSSWLAAQCRLANWPFHQINHTNFSDELSTVHTHTLSLSHTHTHVHIVSIDSLFSPGGHFHSSSYFLGVLKKLVILLKCRVLCHLTCPWAYTDT